MPRPKSSFRELTELAARLRGREGCPWDRAQTYETVKGLLLEEAYEVVDAVASGNFDALEDELGDVLFLVIFAARMAEEEHRFSMDDVIERVRAKLIRRHPPLGEILPIPTARRRKPKGSRKRLRAPAT